MLPDPRVDRFKHPLEDIRKLRRKGVDNTVGPGPVEIVGVGKDRAPGGPEPGGEPLALEKKAGAVVEEKTDERLFGAGERGREGLVDE